MKVRSQRQSRITVPVICQTVLEMNNKIRGNVDFKETTGRVRRYKSRHGIRELNTQGENLLADTW